jgi:hypothetical protein
MHLIAPFSCTGRAFRSLSLTVCRDQLEFPVQPYGRMAAAFDRYHPYTPFSQRRASFVVVFRRFLNLCVNILASGA